MIRDLSQNEVPNPETGPGSAGFTLGREFRT